jgi:transposase-like protein
MRSKAYPRRRKILKTRGHVPTDEAAVKLLWLALRNLTATLGEGSELLAQCPQSIRHRIW